MIKMISDLAKSFVIANDIMKQETGNTNETGNILIIPVYVERKTDISHMMSHIIILITLIRRFHVATLLINYHEFSLLFIRFKFVLEFFLKY